MKERDDELKRKLKKKDKSDKQQESSGMKKGNNELRKELKKEDRLGRLFKLFAVGTGAGGGALAGGAAATAFGANSIPLATAVGKIIGVTIVGSTPVGWVVGGVAAGAAVGYLIARGVYKGGVVDGKKKADSEHLGEEDEDENPVGK